jgi:hypothetical protein
VYISLRGELFNSIPELYDYAQKYRDLFEIITWDRDDLEELIALRIRHFVPELRDASRFECWAAVFSDPRRAYRFMLERSLYRPREIITYATLALEQARRTGRRLPISEKVLYDVELDYSTDRMKDIAAEYRFQFPGLLSVFASFRGRQTRWVRDALEYHCLELSEGVREIADKAHPWVKSADPDFLVDVLWQVGFLRVSDASVTDLRRYTSWPSGSREDLNISLRSVKEFAVHPMFRSSLGIKS